MAIYKDHVFAAKCRLQSLTGSNDTSELPQSLLRVYTRRQARIWASITGVSGFVLLLFDVLDGARYSTHLLLMTWMSMAVVYFAGMVVARLHLPRAVQRACRSSGDVFTDLARIEAGGPLQAFVQRTHRLERASLALPLAVLSLLAPLTLHFVFSLVFLEVDLHRFSSWILVSLIIVGHAHVTLLVLAVLHVVRLRRELDQGLPVVGAPRGFTALLWTTLASTMPGLFLLCVPPPLVFVTGVIFVPWAFAWAAHRAQAERSRLVDVGLGSPGPVDERQASAKRPRTPPNT